MDSSCRIVLSFLLLVEICAIALAAWLGGLQREKTSMSMDDQSATICVSELIAVLEKVRAEHGDLPVYRYDEDYGDTPVEMDVAVKVEESRKLYEDDLKPLPRRVVIGD